VSRYIAFLRAVNVGGRIVKMAQLREVFDAAGFTEVETFIASGNVIFSSRARNSTAVEQQVEARLREALGFDVPTFVRTPAAVAAAAARQAFPATAVSGAGFYAAAFLKTPIDAAGARGLAALESPVDRFAAHGDVVYWLSAARASETKVSLVKFERAVGRAATMRSMVSLGKLAARHCAPDA
jgi:uncharacterized protein (DUF1697 family)